MRWPDAEIERSVKICILCGSDQRDQADERSVLHETELLKKLSPHLVKLFDFHPTHVSLAAPNGSSFLLSQLQETS